MQKTQRYGTCNTMETLLISRAVAADVLPELGKLYKDEGVELRGCLLTQAILPEIKEATEEDWDEEYLAPILSIRVIEVLMKLLIIFINIVQVILSQL